MESPYQPDAASQLLNEPQRPESLKILCILSFIGCGLMLILYGIGSLFLSMDSTTIATFWDKVIESNPQLENADPVQFFHEFGMVCVYGLLATIFSLIGVIMMWRLEKIGFFLYAVAELATNFFSMNINSGEEKSYGGVIFFVAIDLVFIVLYALNLKHMNRRNNNSFVQSGG
jgi:hypothetical protein